MDISVNFGLPPISNNRLRSEVDFYGLSSIVAEKMQLGWIPKSFATWSHGWVFVPLKYVAQLIWMDVESPFHLVATGREVSFLNDHGVTNVVAAGLPFIYADLDDVERLPRSLLVMPPHSLTYTQHNIDEEGYVEYIKSISGDFSTVVFCLYQACIDRGAWCRVLESAGFDWVTGASAQDANSLVRMQKLFRTFDYMTTCTIGSHLIYSAYCGCKVSIAGSFYELNKGVYKNAPYYQRYPEILNHNLKYSCETVIRSKYPFLFVTPAEAAPLIDWASDEVGASFKKKIGELRHYLGWSARAQVGQRLQRLKKYANSPFDVAGKLCRILAKTKA